MLMASNLLRENGATTEGIMACWWPFKAKWSTGTCIYDPRQVSGEEKKTKNKKKQNIFFFFLVWYYHDHSLSNVFRKSLFFLFSKLEQ